MYGEVVEGGTVPYPTPVAWPAPSLLAPGDTDAGLHMLPDPALVPPPALCPCTLCCGFTPLPVSIAADDTEGTECPLEDAGEAGTGDGGVACAAGAVTWLLCDEDPWL